MGSWRYTCKVIRPDGKPCQAHRLANGLCAVHGGRPSLDERKTLAALAAIRGETSKDSDA